MSIQNISRDKTGYNLALFVRFFTAIKRSVFFVSMFVVVRSPYNSQRCGIFFIRLLISFFLVGAAGVATVATDASASSAYKNTVEWQYKKANDYYYTLRNNPALAGKREQWLIGIRELQRIYRIDPKNKRASSCLYTIARMYRTMYQRFGVNADLDKAVSFYTDLLTFFPKGNKADNALYALAQIEQEERGNLKKAVQYYDRLMSTYPKSSKKRLVKRQLEKLIKVLEKNPDYRRNPTESISPPAASTSRPKAPEVTPSVVAPMPQKKAVNARQATAPIKSMEKVAEAPPQKKTKISGSQEQPPVKSPPQPDGPRQQEVKTGQVNRTSQPPPHITPISLPPGRNNKT
ncbi:MAG: hypothetical protein D3910_02835 [Candidatus Electrothrix sp. ATG2]|nr:hypothetical protein [Candidatus Electrothrix sp. ATG2]